MNRTITLSSTILALGAFIACSNDHPAGTTGSHADHGHSEGDGHDHADDHDHAHDGDGAHDDDHDHAHADEAGHSDHGAVIALGQTAIADWTVRATRDQGDLAPGGEAAIDVWLAGGMTKVNAVRFWIGVESAEGSMKALAAIEDPAEPDRWHTHAEIPDPLPAGSALWVELEIEGRGKQAGSIDLFPE